MQSVPVPLQKFHAIPHPMLCQVQAQRVEEKVQPRVSSEEPKRVATSTARALSLHVALEPTIKVRHEFLERHSITRSKAGQDLERHQHKADEQLPKRDPLRQVVHMDRGLCKACLLIHSRARHRYVGAKVEEDGIPARVSLRMWHD